MNQEKTSRNTPVQGRVHTFLSDIRRKNYEVKLENDSGRDPQRQ